MTAHRLPRATARFLIPLLAGMIGCAGPTVRVHEGGRILQHDMRHLRAGDDVEWSEYARSRPDTVLTVSFDAESNASGAAIALTQRDVKQAWRIHLNGRDLGGLEQDEKLMTVYRDVPPHALRDGENVLTIAPSDRDTDDIEVGRIILFDRPPSDLLAQARISVEVVDADSRTGTPSRLTIVNHEGALQTVGATSGPHLAVRPGVVYTGTGSASFGIPAGSYTIYASRGFEFGADSVRLDVDRNGRVERRLTLRREVPTPGWIAADTHVHTLTHSGHGDATEQERMLTIAGEGVELPVLTEHNLNVDLSPVARRMSMDAYFTTVTGNEFTTPVGHFNLFPVRQDESPPDPELDSWSDVETAVSELVREGVVILNHPRDVHAGFRPFGPRRHFASVGQNRSGWTLPANAMEVVNSGAQQTDVLMLVRDWFGMLNAGRPLAPIGSSDSHDVARYVVGQARTYIRVEDDRPSEIDVAEAVRSVRNGHVSASFGLLPEIMVAGRYGPGQLVPSSDSIVIDVRVLAPSWLQADHVTLYANGRAVHESEVEPTSEPGLKWTGKWILPRPTHDIFLAVVAEGPGRTPPFWPIAKPYQPASPEWHPRIVGTTGAVWIDADGDGRRSSARDYAERLVDASGGDSNDLLELLADYDEAVAAQAAALLHEQGRLGSTFEKEAHLQHAAPATRRGFEAFIHELAMEEAYVQ